MANAPSTFEGAHRPLLTATTVTAVITNRRPLISGSGFTWTNNAGQLTLSKTGFLTGLSFITGDCFYIVSGTGITPGYARFDSKTSNDACTLLTPLSGSTASDLVLAHGINPFSVVVSAENSTCDGTSNPKEDLQYAWDFGDTGDTRTFQMWDGSLGRYITTNCNNGQKGLKAVYLWMTPGTKTITLTATAQKDATTTIVDTTTLQVVVVARPRTAATILWFDSVNGNSANDGLDPSGFGVTDGAYNNTTGAFTFTATAKTTSFTPSAGFSSFVMDEECPDWVWLNTGTGGSFVAKRAKILAKVSASQFTLETGLFSGNVTAMTTSSGPKATFADIRSAIGNATVNMCMLARGSTFTNAVNAAADVELGAGLWSYGSGAKPIVERGPVDATIGLLQPTARLFQFGNIDFRVGSGGTHGYMLLSSDGGNTARHAADPLVYQCAMNTDRSPIATVDGGMRTVIWGNTFGGGVTKDGMVLISCYSDAAVVGNSKTGGFSPNATSHHYYIDCEGPQGGVIAYNSGVTAIAGGIAGHCINVNIAYLAGDVIQSRNWLIRGNYCGTGTNHGIDTSQVNNDPTNGRGTDIIVEKNTILCGDGGAASPRAFGCTGAENIVYRRNWISSPTIIDLVALDATPKNLKLQMYLNEIYLPKASTTDTLINFGIDTDGYVAGCQFEQNRIYRSSSAGYIASYKSTTSTFWTIADNTWYTPNEASSFRNLTTPADRTLAQFKSDVSNTTDVGTQPVWVDPANGNFSVAGANTGGRKHHGIAMGIGL